MVQDTHSLGWVGIPCLPLLSAILEVVVHIFNLGGCVATQCEMPYSSQVGTNLSSLIHSHD